MEASLEALRYPIGRFQFPETVSESEMAFAIHTLVVFPEQIFEAVRDLSEEQLDTPYRPDGWTIRQVVHHCADSHLNAFIRFKWALTESNPVIKTYLEALWAELPDSKLDPAVSTSLITGIHHRWVVIMQNMSSADWDRTYIHPEYNRQLSLRQVLMNYDWHCKHHLQHILLCKKRNGY